MLLCIIFGLVFLLQIELSWVQSGEWWGCATQFWAVSKCKTTIPDTSATNIWVSLGGWEAGRRSSLDSPNSHAFSSCSTNHFNALVVLKLDVLFP